MALKYIVGNQIVKHFLAVTVFTLLFAACGVEVPQNAVNCDSVEVDIYPDYRDVAIPCNIAPLNFMVNCEEKDCRVCVTAPSGASIVVESDNDGKIIFPMKSWKKMLSENLDTTLCVDVYVKEKEWTHLKPFSWSVKSDSIDPYLTCRLIEPSYRGHGVLDLVAFNMENNTSKVIASNKKVRPEPLPVDGYSCLNCHATQKNGSGNSSFCFRGKNGGLVVTYQGVSRIVNTKVGDMYAATTYESWHPTLPFIAFSINAVGQAYPVVDVKTEVIDRMSDLVLYDIEKDEMSYIQKSKNRMETFPCWAPDGKSLYYAATDSVLGHVSRHKNLKYDIYRISFDADSLKWGEPERIIPMSQLGLTAHYPQPSPDGKWLLFMVAQYGSSPYRHAECDVYKMNLATKEVSPVREVNVPYASDYCRGWSANGRWILISSRRDDGDYARPYFSYYKEDGSFTKPFQMPHEDPAYDKELMMGYNCPQMADVEPVMTPEKLYHLLDTSHVQPAHYRGTMDIPVDGNTGASVIR
ncbi:MAG: hypothetical protein MJZ14_02460 [Paludibacteraceae bacterium]|nr:hypothetical protein [Paludibacteraceae bacterium]